MSWQDAISAEPVTWGDSITDEIAGFSGAALGFIIGEMEGAQYGYKAGKLASKVTRKYSNSDMAKGKNKRPASRTPSRGRPTKRRTVGPYPTPGRSKSRASTSSRSSIASSTVSAMAKLRRPSITYNIKSESSGGIRAPHVSTQNKKSVSIKKPAKVRITRKFRKQVVKALEPSKSHGKYVEMSTYYNEFDVENGGKQMVYRLGHYSGVDTYIFNPMRVWHAANVLWNAKAPFENSQYTASYNDSVGDIYFNLANTKINVKNSYATYHIKNNSKRCLFIDLYELSPKNNMFHPTDKDALSQWLDNMALETYDSGELINPTKSTNILAATPYTLGMTPNFCKPFMAKWNVEKHTVVMEPGQTHAHFVQGPADVMYDFAKFRKVGNDDPNVKFQDVQKKFTRQLLMVVRTDLVRTTDSALRAGVNDLSGELSNNKQGILVEWKHYFHLECPEQVGGTITTASGNSGMTLDKRRDVYAYKNWAEGNGKVLVRVEELTPGIATA